MLVVRDSKEKPLEESLPGARDATDAAARLEASSGLGLEAI